MIWLLLLASIEAHLDCSDLRQGQYTCLEPRILNSTQEYENCQKSRTVRIPCLPLANLTCRLSSGEVKVFNGSETAKDLVKTLPCRWTNGKSYTISCLLSLFLGVFGIDRFYLGYPVLGIIKLSTVGMLGIGALSDFLLILLQKVGPSDGSDLILPYYGFRVNYLWSDEHTKVFNIDATTSNSTSIMGAFFLSTFVIGSLTAAYYFLCSAPKN